MSDILILVLSTGEKIVAEVDEQQGAYLASNPVEIVEQRSYEGESRMGLTQYLPYAKDGAGLIIPTIMAVVTFPNDELLAAYKNLVAKSKSSIITPEQPSIILAS